MLRSLLAGSVGLASLVAGGAWAAFRPPGAETRGAVQHAAAGTVFAGLVVDVLSRLLTSPVGATPLIAGMCSGLGAMLLIRTKGAKAGGTTLGLTIAADIVVDGLLIGLSTATGASTAPLFVAALVPEMTLLGVTVSQAFSGPKASSAKRLATPLILGLGVVGGAAVGAWAQTGPAWLTTFVEAFGAVTLAYLVTEELLREAHHQPESAFNAGLFFAGFIPLFVLAALFT